MSAEWIIAKTKPSQEQYAALNIRRQPHAQAEPYVPLFFDKRRSMRVALFPSYIFVKIRDGYFHFLNSTFGISSVMLSTNGPATVSKNVIKELKARENKNGVILLPEQIATSLTVGSKLTIQQRRGHNPFNGLTGLYQGMESRDRVSILLSLLGREVTVSVRTTDVIAA